jgi:hypothetical protein
MLGFALVNTFRLASGGVDVQLYLRKFLKRSTPYGPQVANLQHIHPRGNSGPNHVHLNNLRSMHALKGISRIQWVQRETANPQLRSRQVAFFMN